MNKLAKWLPFKFKRKQQDDPAPSKSAMTASSGPPMSQLFDNMLSDRFWRDPFSMFADTDRFFGDFSPSKFDPKIDILDEGKHVSLTAELPGLSREDIELSVHDGMLVVKGEKKSETKNEEEGCYRLERYFGSFQRAVPLPAELDVTKAEASFDKGVLKVRFPKTGEPAAAKQIPIG